MNGLLTFCSKLSKQTMVMEQVITLSTEPTEGEIVKSHPLFSFINIGQRGRIRGNTLYRRCITPSVAMVCLLQLATKCQQIIHKLDTLYVTGLFHARCTFSHMY